VQRRPSAVEILRAIDEVILTYPRAVPAGSDAAENTIACGPQRQSRKETPTNSIF
jgi:hypothetical protein